MIKYINTINCKLCFTCEYSRHINSDELICTEKSSSNNSISYEYVLEYYEDVKNYCENFKQKEQDRGKVLYIIDKIH